MTIRSILSEHTGLIRPILFFSGLPRRLSGKEFACQAVDIGLISGSGRSPGEGNGNPFQYSYLKNPMDRGTWRATVHGVARV